MIKITDPTKRLQKITETVIEGDSVTIEKKDGTRYIITEKKEGGFSVKKVAGKRDPLGTISVTAPHSNHFILK